MQNQYTKNNSHIEKECKCGHFTNLNLIDFTFSFIAKITFSSQEGKVTIFLTYAHMKHRLFSHPYMSPSSIFLSSTAGISFWHLYCYKNDDILFAERTLVTCV